MIHVGVCSADTEVGATVEECLKTRNCWYDLKRFAGDIMEVFQYLEQNLIDLLFFDMDSQEKVEAAETIMERNPNQRMILLTDNKENLDRDSLKNSFFCLPKREIRSKMPVILDRYYAREHALKRQRMIVNNKSRQIVVELEDVLYLERDKRNSILYCTEGEQVTSTQDLSALQEFIGRDDFIRCHNSYMVNLNYVKEICRNEFILKNGQKIPISRRYLEETRRRMKQWADSI